MNILIPDSWLRDFLKTKATTKQIKDCLSLCGPSIERVHIVGNETVYDVEITTNRIDSMSINGIAREAAAILPEFNIQATYVPPKIPTAEHIQGAKPLGITIQNDPKLCQRIIAIKLENITPGESPSWLKQRLELVGQRPLNNIIDITNYVMWEMGHPIHAFDYDRLKEKTIIVREAIKGEHITTLDAKTHRLHGGEIIFDDGTGNIIDLPGIMGAKNTVITEKTRNVLLFIENSDPTKIRYASMGLAIRSQAAVLNEKSPDPELALTTLLRAVTLAKEITGGKVASKLVDIYPHPHTSKPIALEQTKLNTYIGIQFPKLQVKRILATLGCHVSETKGLYSVTPPCWRSEDLRIDEDIIEEIARIYGYHNIQSKLPDKAPPVVVPEKALMWEEEIKIRLRDWGYTEVYTYSMISEKLMETFSLDKKTAYKITNPLSGEWVYMRPSLLPSMHATIQENLNHRKDLQLFELSMHYEYQPHDLPKERPTLLIAWTGQKYREAKGLQESICSLFGVTEMYGAIIQKDQVTYLELPFDILVAHANPARTYHPIAKYPPIVEDISFTIPSDVSISNMIETFTKLHKLIQSIILLDTYKQNRTFRITYLDSDKTLTANDVKPIREKIIAIATKDFGATFKTAP